MAIAEALERKGSTTEQAMRAADDLRADHALEISRLASPTHVSAGTEAAGIEVGRVREARNKLNPLWEGTKKLFEGDWSTPWGRMDAFQKGIVRTMYKQNKKNAAKPQPELKPVHTARSRWNPVPGYGGK